MTSINNLKKVIETLSPEHHIEILSIIMKHKDVCINENNNGTFVNLSEMDSNIIKELEKYVDYVIKQQNHLDIVEKEKKRIEKEFFSNDNKL